MACPSFSPHVQAVMAQPTNIRNTTIIARGDYVISELADVMLSRAGIVTKLENDPYYADLDRQDTKIVTKSTASCLFFEMGDVVSIKQETKGNHFLIYLITSPGVVDFSFKIAPALRISDGALVVVDGINGLCLQTETVLRQALAERIKPVVLITKADAFLEPHFTKEDLYQSCCYAIQKVNAVISSHSDTALGDLQVYPGNGTVAFSSATYHWGFSLRQFATRYSKKFGVDRDKVMAKLWGDNFFDPTTRKWTANPKDANGQPLERAFNAFVLDPLCGIRDAVQNFQKDQINSICDRLGIVLRPDEKELEGKALLDVIMRAFLPCGDALLDMMVINLPSPVSAQAYRVDTLYEGPMDDESAIGIRQCNHKAPLVFYVAKMIPTSDKGRFYAFGRVFSGNISTGQQVRIQGPDFMPGRKHDLFVKSIQRTYMAMGRYIYPIEDCPAGNIAILAGIDQFLLKSGTITTSETAHNMRLIKLSTSPIVQIAVEPQTPTDLPELLKGLEYLSKSDPYIQTWVTESGEYVVAGAGELHLEISLKELNEYTSIPLNVSDPFVSYRETVKSESRIVALAKSQNRHNRLYVKAFPLDAQLVDAIESGKVCPRQDPKLRAQLMADEFGWDPALARKIWAFGPDTTGPNMLVDDTKGVQFINEIKDSCVAALHWITKEGVLAEENMRGVQFKIMDVTMMSDAIHRGSGQIMPTLRRACYGASLLAEPGLQEPVCLVEIQCPESDVDMIFNCLNQRHGEVFSHEGRPAGVSTLTIKAYIPVSTSFGFQKEVRDLTGGRAFSQSVFHHWELMDGSPFDEGSMVHDIVTQIRVRKGLQPDIPPLETYYDKL